MPRKATKKDPDFSADNSKDPIRPEAPNEEQLFKGLIESISPVPIHLWKWLKIEGGGMRQGFWGMLMLMLVASYFGYRFGKPDPDEQRKIKDETRDLTARNRELAMQIRHLEDRNLNLAKLDQKNAEIVASVAPLILRAKEEYPNAETQDGIKRILASLDNLKSTVVKRRNFDAEEFAALRTILKSSTFKGKVRIQPALFDSGAIAYAEQIEQAFKDSGYDVSLDGPGNLTANSAISWNFTGERIMVHDTKAIPKHTREIQKAFSSLGRVMLGDSLDEVSADTVVIAVGGHP